MTQTTSIRCSLSGYCMLTYRQAARRRECDAAWDRKSPMQLKNAQAIVSDIFSVGRTKIFEEATGVV